MAEPGKKTRWRETEFVFIEIIAKYISLTLKAVYLRRSYYSCAFVCLFLGGTGAGRGKRSHKGQRRMFTNEEELAQQHEQEEKKKAWRVSDHFLPNFCLA